MSETVEVVIKIPEEWIEQFKAFKHPSTLETIILQGAVLPKGHGRLIDADAFEHRCMFDSNVEDMQDVIYALLDYPSVIEADREVEDEGSGV